MTQEGISGDLVRATQPITLSVPTGASSFAQAVLASGLPDAELAAILHHGGLWCAGRRILDPALPARTGELLTLHRPPTGQYDQVIVTANDILYEDEWLLALNKRAGWYTGATPWDIYGNALAALQQLIKDRADPPHYLHLAHQLDRGTSGVLLFARRPEANAPLQAAFAGHSATKEYYCLCGGLPSDSYELCSGHGRERGGRFRIYPLDQVGQPLPGGGRIKFAHTRFHLLEPFTAAALLLAQPLTGRSHQIRLHLAHLGHPLLGDSRYGGHSSYAGQELPFPLLHAARLRVPHPGTTSSLSLEAPLPEHFSEILKLLVNQQSAA